MGLQRVRRDWAPDTDNGVCSLLWNAPQKDGWIRFRDRYLRKQMLLFSKSCLTLCNPMDCSTPGSPVLHYLLEFCHAHVHQVDDAIQPSHPLSSPSPALNLSQHQSFPVSQLFTSGGQSIGASASASVLPMNTQVWFPLGLTGLISLQSKGFSKASPPPQYESMSSSVLSLPYGSTETFKHDYWKDDMCAQSSPTLCNPMDYSQPGSSVYGIFQARILEWVAISYSRVSFQPRDQTHIFSVSCIDRQILYHCKKP